MKTDTLVTYRAHPIWLEVDGTYARFHTQLEGAKNTTSAVSLEALQQLIDRFLTKKIKSRVLHLEVLTGDPEPQVVTGINLHTDEVTGLSESGRFSVVRDFFPDVPWLRDALKKRQALVTALDELDGILRPYKIAARRSMGKYHTHVRVDYESATDALQAEYDEKKALAEEAR